MPRYFFHVRSDHGLDRDSEGTDLDDLMAAKREGVASAKELIASALRAGMPLPRSLDRSFEIEDATGARVMTIPFAWAAEADDHRPPRRR